MGGVQDRWQQHGHDPKKQEPASGRHAVSAEALNFVLEAAEEEPAAENEQKVGQNRSQEGALNQSEHVLLNGNDSHDHLGEISEGRVQQPSLLGRRRASGPERRTRRRNRRATSPSRSRSGPTE